MPKWSMGWLDKFKRQYSIRQYTTFGKAGSVDVASVLKELDILNNKLCPYAKSNIYNMDKMALYWKTLLD